MNLPEPFSCEVFSPSHFEKEHEITLKGNPVRFRSVCEDTVFYAPEGKPEASLFTISYERIGCDRSRPVLFLWNGGPGSATSTLHLECFGPWQIARNCDDFPVYGLEDNPECLLDQCDLVFVDPVGVGLSRLLDPQKADKYYCVDGDARSVAFTMVEWLRRRNRFDSPVHICGESYGTVRACRVLAELGRSPMSESRMVLGMPVSSVTLIGLATSEDGADIDRTIALLPAMAATFWYHHRDRDLSGPGMRQFVSSAWDFGCRELLSAYFSGDELPADREEVLSVRLEAFTGLPRDYWLSHHLHLENVRDYMTRLLPGCTLDLYDARRTVPDGTPYNEIGSGNTPILVMNGLLLPRLGVSLQRLYYTGNINVNLQFSYETERLEASAQRTHLQCLRDSMLANPGMRVLFASGLYDLCTYAGNTRYCATHAGLPKERVLIRDYPGGHGVYSSQEGRRCFLEDIRSLTGRERAEADE